MISIDYMVVADAATSADGKHYIHGGGWDTIFAAYFPVVHNAIAVAFLLRVPWNDANFRARVEVDLLDADEHSILPNPPGPLGGPITVGRPPTVIPGSDLIAPFVFNLGGTTFNGPGDYVIVMRIDGNVVKRHVIHLRSMANPAPIANQGT